MLTKQPVDQVTSLEDNELTKKLVCKHLLDKQPENKLTSWWNDPAPLCCSEIEKNGVT